MGGLCYILIYVDNSVVGMDYFGGLREELINIRMLPLE